MVKPPKSWLEEYNAIHKSKHMNDDKSNDGSNRNKKRPRGSFGSNMDNSFRHYMARKITLQRDQFGLVLPPPPPATTAIPLPSFKDYSVDVKDDCHVFKDGKVKEKYPNDDSQKKSLKKRTKSVRFKDCDEYYTDVNDIGPPTTTTITNATITHNNAEQKDRNGRGVVGEGMTGVLSRLKRKHGPNLKRGKKRKKKPSMNKVLVGKTFPKKELQNKLKQESKDSIVMDFKIQGMEGDKEINQRNSQFSTSSDTTSSMTCTDGNTESQSTNIIQSSNECETETNHDDNESTISTTSSSQETTKKTPTITELKRQRPDLFFLGITVMVNGYTNPCSDTIMRTMHRYGGSLEKYETDCVTHIIAEHLSTAKANIYKRQKKPLPVVYPKWIVDCVDAKKLLPHQDYLLDEVKDDNLGINTSVKSYFLKNANKQGDDLCKRNDGIITTTTGVAVGSNQPQVTSTKSNFGTSPSDGYKTVPKAKSNNVVVDTPNTDRNESMTCPQKNALTSTTTPAPTSFSGPRTVGNDPNFLDAYFANSRLSFIGSFKQRVQSKSSSTMGKSHEIISRNNRQGAEKYVYHVDMDCFFAAIAVRNYPQFKDKPVAVGHGWKTDPNGVRKDSSASTTVQRSSSNTSSKNSTSELSTCNYAARKYGVRKGMFAQRARQLCPDLVILPYDYEGYEEASSTVAHILEQYSQEYCGIIEQVSCDEFYIELSFHIDDVDESCEIKDLVRDVGNKIRKDIRNATECTASIGIGGNKLLAKLATDKVKEHEGDGIYLVDNVKWFLSNVKLRDLPGVGYRLDKKLQSHNLFSVSDVWTMGNDTELCSILGKGNGSKIYMYCQGLDTRPVKAAERKTIGAECNYGVRFNGPYGVDYMMAGLAKEVVKRMTTIGVKGKHMTVKVKERVENAPPPGKFNGHGKCNDHSKSCNLPSTSAIRDADMFCREGMKLFLEIGIPPEKIRGMGMVISKLENECQNNQCKSKDKMDRWLQRALQDNQNLQEVVEFDNNIHASPNCSRGGNDEDAECSTLELNTNNGESKDSNHDPEDDIEIIKVKSPNRSNIHIPPHEDISMDDVMALPLDLQEEVMNMIKERGDTAGNSNLSFQSAQSESSQSSSNKPASSLPPSMSTPKSPKRVKRFKSLPTKKIQSDGQVDMKRMMKLVAVKSGQDQLEYDGEQVSLTQLGHLPLDLQLQIANCDEVVMKKTRSTSLKSPQPKARKSLFNENIGYNKESDDEIEILSCSSEQHSVEAEESDITCLSRWLHEHSNPNQEDLMKMQAFLCICISERRLDDTVTFLRLIKRKAHSWSPTSYSGLLKSCNNHLMQCQGRKLDLHRLGL